MSSRQLKRLVLVIPACILVALALLTGPSCHRSTTPVQVALVGDVLKQDVDPAKETPLSEVLVTAVAGSVTTSAHSGPTGLFTVTLPRLNPGESVVLNFKHAAYKPLQIIATKPGDQLYIARMQPLPLPSQGQQTTTAAAAPAKAVQLNNIRVRYSLMEVSTVDVGSLAKEITAYNLGNVPCRGRLPCSPDGRWAASRTDLPLDAGAGNEFRNLRVLCVAGPCAFTRIVSPDFTHPARTVTVSILNWSDTAVFLVEADVIRTMETDSTQYAYPFTLDSTMNFALPPNSEGPSIEADVDGQQTVFPLGPAAILPWATCSIEVSQQKNEIFRCQLKPGYRF